MTADRSAKSKVCLADISYLSLLVVYSLFMFVCALLLAVRYLRDHMLHLREYNHTGGLQKPTLQELCASMETGDSVFSFHRVFDDVPGVEKPEGSESEHMASVHIVSASQLNI